MNTYNAYDLIDKKKWKAFLTGLDLGNHTFRFNSIKDIKSCKAIGYDMNSDDTGRQYYFTIDKAELYVGITIKEEKKDDKHKTKGRP